MKSIDIVKEFIHYDINEAVRAIGGEYTLTKEVKLPFEGEEVLYITGFAVFDTSCCGAGGCGYAIVPGFIKEWKIGFSESNRPISKVRPITEPDTQKKIEAIIKKAEMVQEVRFE